MMLDSIERDRKWFLKAKPEELFEIFSNGKQPAGNDEFLRKLAAMTQEERDAVLNRLID